MKYIKDLNSMLLQDFSSDFELNNLISRPTENISRVSNIVNKIEKDIIKR
jgi:hypothetical protein